MPVASEPIVVNTGPLLALQACEASHLLVELHAAVLVPEVVLSEILRGILLRAKRLGLIARVGPRLEAMRASGVWLSPRLLAQALKEAGE